MESPLFVAILKASPGRAWCVDFCLWGVTAGELFLRLFKKRNKLLGTPQTNGIFCLRIW